MKRYLTSFFLSIVLSFLLVVLILSAVAVPFVTSSSSYVKVAEKYSLAEKVYEDIKLHFIDLSGSTNIPSEVFEDAITPQVVNEVLPDYIKSVMDYTFKRSESIDKIDIDLSVLDTNITVFFDKFAQENNIERDDAFFKQRDLTIKEVKEDIMSYMQLSVLKKASDILRPFAMSFTTYAYIAILAVLVICLLLVYLIMRIYYSHSAYWIFLSLGCACLLLILVFGGMRLSNFFDGFILSETVAKTVVTGLLKMLCDRIVVIATVILAVSAGFISLFFYKNKLQR